jgi:hypothetical protein
MYLADDSQGSVLDRHQIMSVNEVLRDGKLTRDRQRVNTKREADAYRTANV